VSQPKRYIPSNHRSADFGMAESSEGRWVDYSDYAALQTEVESLKKEIGFMSARQSPQVFNLMEIERLQAENERLRSDSEKLKTLRADAQNVAIAFAKFDNGLIDTPRWVLQAVLRDAINTLIRASKEVKP